MVRVRLRRRSPPGSSSATDHEWRDVLLARRDPVDVGHAGRHHQLIGDIGPQFQCQRRQVAVGIKRDPRADQVAVGVFDADGVGRYCFRAEVGIEADLKLLKILPSLEENLKLF